MHFSTHVKNLIGEAGTLLKADRQSLIDGMRDLLPRAARLLRTKDFDFWIRELNSIGDDELPITLYGLREAERRIANCQPTRDGLQLALSAASEKLFTYCDEEDMCIAQSDNHYYHHIPTGKVFRSSELGFSEPKLIIGNWLTEVRIAKKSELPFPAEKYFT